MNNYHYFRRHLLFSAIFLANLAVGIIILLPETSLLLLASHTHVSLDIVGWIFTATSLGSLSGATLAGVLSARWPVKYLIVIGLVMMGFSTLVVPWTPIFAILFAAQCLQGIGFGVFNVGLNVIVAREFRDTLGSTLNTLHSAFGVGALSGPLLLSLALTELQQPMWAFVVSPVILLIAIIMLLGQPVSEKVEEEMTVYRPAASIRAMLLQGVIWLTALQLFLYVGSEVSFGSWIVTAVSQSAAIPLAAAAPIATVFWIGLTCGRLLGAQILRRGILSEKGLLYICFIGGGVGIVIVAGFPGLLWLSFSATLLTGLCFGPVFPSVMALASRRFVYNLGFVSSMILVSTGVSGLIFPVLVGIVMTHAGAGWGLAIPAFLALLIVVPFYLVTGRQGSISLPQKAPVSSTK